MRFIQGLQRSAGFCRRHAREGFSDLLLVAGLACLAWGLWGYDPRIAFCAVGALILYAGWEMGAP